MKIYSLELFNGIVACLPGVELVKGIIKRNSPPKWFPTQFVDLQSPKRNAFGNLQVEVSQALNGAALSTGCAPI